ncbi:Crp/Fnr family transcriptional regulator [Faecalimonas sp.]
MTEQNRKYLEERLTFWNQITKEEQEILIQNTAVVKYTQGQNIYDAQQECIGVLLIKSGELRTYILSEEGKEVTLYRLSDDDVCILSASCILKNITFDVHVDAEKDTEVLLINSSVFSALSQKNIYVEAFGLRLTADRFSDVMWAMEQILFMSFDRRLAIFLLDEMAKMGTDILPFTHEQIAKYVGSAREVVSRMLKYFAKEGMVELSRGSIKIVDRQKLKKLL